MAILHVTDLEVTSAEDHELIAAFDDGTCRRVWLTALLTGCFEPLRDPAHPTRTRWNSTSPPKRSKTRPARRFRLSLLPPKHSKHRRASRLNCEPEEQGAAERAAVAA